MFRTISNSAQTVCGGNRLNGRDSLTLFSPLCVRSLSLSLCCSSGPCSSPPTPHPTLPLSCFTSQDYLFVGLEGHKEAGGCKCKQDNGGVMGGAAAFTAVWNLLPALLHRLFSLLLSSQGALSWTLQYCFNFLLKKGLRVQLTDCIKKNEERFSVFLKTDAFPSSFSK